jgi:hypothetical protein
VAIGAFTDGLKTDPRAPSSSSGWPGRDGARDSIWARGHIQKILREFGLYTLSQLVNGHLNPRRL